MADISPAVNTFVIVYQDERKSIFRFYSLIQGGRFGSIYDEFFDEFTSLAAFNESMANVGQPRLTEDPFTTDPTFPESSPEPV
jgi:hypothetical protein|tara:strand:+ start:145 stop:393 length:249 start_codon:yes stop_codon:yes gene_type:complete